MSAVARGAVAAPAHAQVRVDAWLLGALLLGAALRLFRLDAAPLWLDEVLTANWLGLPWRDMLQAALTDNHPPLYFLLLKAWTLLAGTSEVALRLPSALASLAAVGLTAALATSVAGATAGRWAAWFAALSPYLVAHGQEARMYGLVSALGAAQLLLLARVLTAARPRLGWGFALIAASLAATHYYAAVIGLAELAVAAWLAARQGRLRALGAPAVCAAAAAAVALGAAWWLARHEAGSHYGLGAAVIPGALWTAVGGYALLPSSAALHAGGLRAAAPYAPLALCGAVAVAVLAPAGWRRLAAAPRWLLLAAVGVALAVPAAAQLVAPVGFHPRYLAASLPALLALLAAGAPARLGRDAGSLAALLLLGVLAAGTARYGADPSLGREDVRAAGAWLDAQVGVDEEILITSSEMQLLARYHWPARRLRLYPDKRMVATTANATALAAAVAPPAGGRRWFVFGRAWESDPDGALRAALRAGWRDCGGAALRGVDILCLQGDA